MAELDLAAPGNTPPDEMRPVERVLDEDGVWITKTRTRQSKSIDTATTPIEYITAGIYYRLETEHISDKIEWLVTSARTVPGPLVVSRTESPGGVTKVETWQIVDATTVPDGTSSTVTSPVSALAEDDVVGKTAVIAKRKQTLYLNQDGTPRTFAVDGNNLPTGGNPIFLQEKWVDELFCDENSFRQLQPSPGLLPVIGAPYSTGGVVSGGAVTSITVTGGGTGFGSVALVAVARSLGIRAIAHATMKANAIVSVVAVGSGWVIGETITIPGGTFTTATILTVASVALASASLNAPGTGYAPTQILTLVGGTFSTAATYTIATVKLLTLALNAAGTNYLAADVLTLVGGTGTAATLTVNTIKMVTGGANAAGTGYAIADNIVFAGGTSTVKGSAAVTGLTLATIAILSGGTGYSNSDVITLVGGTHSVTVTLTVTSVGGGGAITGFSYTTRGIYTAVPTSFTSTGGGGSGATFNTALWGIHDIGTLSGGTYTVGAATPTQDGTSTTSGTGATFSGFVYGLNTFTETTAGSYSGSLATTFTVTGGAGSGATFNTPTWGANSVTPIQGGSYTGSLPTNFTTTVNTGGGSGATLNSPTWGLGSPTITTAGSYTVLPPISLVTATKASGKAGANYAVGDTIALAGGTGTPPVLTVASTTGGLSTGPIGTVTVTTAGSLTALPSATDPDGQVTRSNWTQASTSANGHGAEFTATYTVDIAGLTGSVAGTGAEVKLSYTVNTIVVEIAGTRYATAPVVTVTGTAGTAATATAAVSTTTIAQTDGYVVDHWRETTDGPMVWVHWVTLPTAWLATNGTQVCQSTAQWVRSGAFSNAAAITHNPPWPGVDFQMTPPLSAEFSAIVQRNFSVGPLPNYGQGSPSLFQTFSITTPGAGSRLFPIRDRTIHPAIEYIVSDGSYAEIFPASTVTGLYGTLYCIDCKQKRIRGYLHMIESTFVDPNNGG